MTTSVAAGEFPERLLLAHEAQDDDEDVDDIDVQLQGSINVLLRGNLVLAAAHNLLGVIDEEL